MGTIPDNFEGFAPTSASILVSPISCRRVGSQDPERPRTRPAGKAGLSGQWQPGGGRLRAVDALRPARFRSGSIT